MMQIATIPGNATLTLTASGEGAQPDQKPEAGAGSGSFCAWLMTRMMSHSNSGEVIGPDAGVYRPVLLHGPGFAQKRTKESEAEGILTRGGAGFSRLSAGHKAVAREKDCPCPAEKYHVATVHSDGAETAIPVAAEPCENKEGPVVQGQDRKSVV